MGSIAFRLKNDRIPFDVMKENERAFPSGAGGKPPVQET